MALQTFISLGNGINLPTTYARVTSVSFTKNEVIANVGWWVDFEARTLNLPMINQQSYSLPHTEEVSLAYVYNELKALDEFAGAEDI